MRRVLVLFTLFACYAAAVAQQPYVVDHYKVAIDLAADGSMDVTETIQVTFNEERHGIFRFIPVHYDTGRGVARTVFLSSIQTTDETGTPLTTQITREGPNLKIRVGDKGVLLPPGTRKTYQFRYHAKGMINWFDSPSDWEPYTELYWNLTGDQWDTPIMKTEFSIRFPDSPGGKGVRVRVFAGQYGSRDEQTLAKPGSATDERLGTTLELASSTVKGTCRRALEPGAGFTVALDLPAGAISKPTPTEAAMMFLLPNLGFAIPILMLILMGILFLRYGKDPNAGPMVVEFDPPEDLPGPESGALLDQRVDSRDLVAGIISLAVKGCLIIHPKETGLVFKKRTADLELTQKAAGSELSAYESTLLEYLSASGTNMVDETDLREHVAPHVMELKSLVYGALVDRGYYAASPSTVRIGWAVGGIAVCVLLAFLAFVISPVHEPVPSIVGGVLGGLVALAFAPFMPHRTKTGALAWAKVKGFEEFMRRARGQEIEWLQQKHPDQLLFEKYLPHAVAFGLTEQWAKAFEGIVHEMPSWYAAPYGTPFHSYYFAGDLVAINNSISSAATTPPRSSGASGGSSGFGGGGFSGGGFGGGGGGSW